MVACVTHLWPSFWLKNEKGKRSRRRRRIKQKDREREREKKRRTNERKVSNLSIWSLVGWKNRKGEERIKLMLEHLGDKDRIEFLKWRKRTRRTRFTHTQFFSIRLLSIFSSDTSYTWSLKDAFSFIICGFFSLPHFMVARFYFFIHTLKFKWFTLWTYQKRKKGKGWQKFCTKISMPK